MSNKGEGETSPNNSRTELTVNSCFDCIHSVNNGTDFLDHPLPLGLQADNQPFLKLGFQPDALSTQCIDKVVAVRGGLLSQLLT